MPLDSVAVGSNQREIFVLGDPVSSAQLQNILALADAKNLSGTYAGLVGAVHWLLNASGNYDQMRSAIGTTGVLAVSTESSKTTYSVGVTGFTPAATATDFWQIIGSNTKTVRVQRISISGFATAAITQDIQLIKRSTANTGGTPSALTIVPYDANDAAPTAVVNTFAANPSPLGTSLGIARSAKLNLGATGAAGSIVWDFSTRNTKGLVLRGVAQSLNLNWNGAAIPGGTTLDIDVEFTEE